MLHLLSRVRSLVWRTLAERRFDDLARGVERSGHLGRQGRRAWLRRGEHRELAAHETLRLEAGDHVLVLSGALELDARGRVKKKRRAPTLVGSPPLMSETRGVSGR